MNTVEHVVTKRGLVPQKFQIRQDTSDIKAIDEVFKKNAYQKKTFQIEPLDRWLDCGCNVGAFSALVFAKGGQARSYEAEPVNALLARKNLELNGYAAHVVNLAVMPDSWDRDTIEFYVNDRPLALRRHSIYPPKKGGQKIVVPTRRLRDLLVDGFDCVKLNIEGAEVPLLTEATDFRGMRKLVFEWSFDKEPRMQVLRDLLAKLQANFREVQWSKKLPETKKWEFYPPNVYVYAQR